MQGPSPAASAQNVPEEQGQEAISLTVFVPIITRLFAVKFRWDFLWAALCLLFAVHFAFRGGFEGS